MATNDLVMSNEDIAAELNSDTDVSDSSEDAVTDHPDLDSDEEIPSWEDNAEGDDEEDADSDTPAPAKKKQAQTVKQYKANGKVVEVDMADQARVDQLITFGLGARQAFSERDKLKKDLGTKDKTIAELGRYKELWTKLEAAKGDHDALYEKIFGRKFDDTYAERKQQREEYESATPEERRLLDIQRKIDAQQKAWEEKQKALEERDRDLAEKTSAAERKEVRAQLLPEFYKHEFSSKVKDPEAAQELNEALWKLTVGRLKKYGDMDELDPALVRSEFAKVAKMLAGNAEQAAKTKVKEITEEKKKVAKQQAQVASTRNYAGNKDVSKLSKEKDPVKLFRKMFG